MPLDTIAAGRAWTYSHNIGRRATAGMGFNWPVAMAVGKDGVMFVANRTPHITKFTLDQEFIHEFGRTGEFVFLSGLALDKDQNLYASDEWRNCITVNRLRTSRMIRQHRIGTLATGWCCLPSIRCCMASSY